MTSDSDGRGAVTFSAAGAREGFRRCLPVAAGVGGYGLVFGVVARQAGLSTAEAALMSATVFAGAAQLIAVELWADPIPVVAVLTTVAVVNARYVLMGAALRPWFARLGLREAYGSMFFLIDETWALAMGDLTEGSGRGAFLLGSGVAVWLFWVAATVVGASVGAAIGDPSQYGLDFVLPAIFLAIATELWDGKATLLPWAVAFLVAVVTADVFPGRWYILAGGIAGSLVEVIRVSR
ncbi:AzlC family ABC transporter permease [Halolamina salifodinae]|uniref:4-azaleucine resistance transporter AzlC n=1 Tax=Halolamina salifodinae TaxID=1202767 RepID=A0A8T4GYT3_9EURY|nr:AzlC family ABC transporter permease [Halolamina salifodinae]MBP1988179.1 4-azaleucine resistance transporter AzlC [Halolamina salifodinae]